MKISQLMYNTSADIDIRKRALQRKETTEAYRKSAQYQTSKNPMVEALENLLSGKTEQDLYRAEEELRNNDEVLPEKDVATDRTKQEQLQLPEMRQEIRQLQMTEQEVVKHEQAHKSVGGSVTGPVSYTYTDGPDDKRYIDGGEVPISAREGSTPEETLAILKRVRAAALAPAEPSPQDLRVAAKATSKIPQVQGEIAQQKYEELTSSDSEQEPFTGVNLTPQIPNRFLNDFSKRDASRPNFFGQNIEQQIFNRAFNQAKSKYYQHIAMVNNGYRSFEEPKISHMA